MSLAYGHQGFLGLGEESTLGTGVAAEEYYRIQEENMKLERQYDAKNGLGTVSQHEPVAGKRTVTGGFTMYQPWESAGLPLKHAMGVDTPSGVGPYAHSLSLANALPTGLSVIVNRDASALGGSSCFRYLGCQINRLTLMCEEGDALKTQVEFLGLNRELMAKPTPTYPAAGLIEWDQLTVFDIDANGSPISLAVRNFEFTIDNKLDEDRFKLGSDTRIGHGRSAPREITLSAEVEFTDLNAYNIWLNLTAHDWQIKFVNGTDILSIDMPNFVIDEAEPSMSGPGAILLPIKGKALRSAADNDELTVTLTNDTATIP